MNIVVEAFKKAYIPNKELSKMIVILTNKRLYNILNKTGKDDILNLLIHDEDKEVDVEKDEVSEEGIQNRIDFLFRFKYFLENGDQPFDIEQHIDKYLETYKGLNSSGYLDKDSLDIVNVEKSAEVLKDNVVMALATIIAIHGHKISFHLENDK